MQIRGHLIVGLASAAHLSWAVMLWNDGCLDGTREVRLAGVCGVTALSQLSELGTSLPDFLIVAAVAALVPFILPIRGLAMLACLAPQQIFLVVGALSCLQAIIVGHFGDGVERARDFLYADLMWPIYVCVAHMIATVWSYQDRGRG